LATLPIGITAIGGRAPATFVREDLLVLLCS
jgi:hypothetical protein